MATFGRRRSDRARGFTLIELLIVVAIIAILAAIAVPNFLEAQTRSKVARAKADMRTVAVAIESYATDNNSYPWVRNLAPGYQLPTSPEPSLGLYGRGMTTPISYISSLFKDPFGGPLLADDDPAYSANTGEYFYATQVYYDERDFGGPNGEAWKISPTSSGGMSQWALESRGPDRYWARPGGVAPAGDEIDVAYKWQYDPTNGSISGGNIVRSGP